MRSWLMIFFYTAVLIAAGQKTTLRGVAPGAEMKRITLTKNADLLTFIEMPLAQSKVDSLGNFNFTIDIQDVEFVTLAIDFHKAELYIEPGKQYSLKIAPMRYEDYTEVNPFIQSQKLTIDLENSDSEELNNAIVKFNATYSSFLMDHFNALYRDRNRDLLDTFRLAISREFGVIKNSYLNTMVRYKVASLEQLTRYYNVPAIGYRYFSTQPIQYNNTEYMEFFNSYFSKYLMAGSNILRRLDYKTLMNSANPYDLIMRSISVDTLLKKEPLRELVLLKGLMEMYNSAGYDQKAVINVINEIGQKSDSKQNKLIAGNLVKLLSKLKPGTPAPDFTLQDKNQQMVALHSLKGKPVVLNFWTTYCEGCLAEMDLLKSIYDKYGSRAHFVSIAADKYFSKMLYFVNLKKEYIWNFLHIGDQSEVLKEYDVRSYPLFILIDKEGKITKYPASLPSAGLEAELENLLIR